MKSVLDLIRSFVRDHSLPAPGERVLCGISGGTDSTALVVALSRLADELGVEVVAAHVDHRLRGSESARDARAAEALARDLGLAFRCLGPASGPPSGVSTEAWARTIRREILTDIAREMGAARIMLAHTRDDQAETVLFRALTGTSLTGLAAMRPVSPDGVWLRPLLGARRRELRRALRAEGIPWVEDGSNRDGRRPRGRIRHELFPLLDARLGPGLEAALGRLAEEAADVDDYLSGQARALLAEMLTAGGPEREVRLVTGPAAAYHPVVRRYALRRAYERVRGGRQDLGRVHLVALERLLSGSGELHLPGGVCARSEQGRLTLVQGAAEDQEPWPEIPIPAGATVAMPGRRSRLTSRVVPRGALGCTPPCERHAVWLDADAVQPPLRIRPRRPGDRFEPFGAPGGRKVSDVMIDRRVPRGERDRVPLLVDEAGILWLVGVRRGARAAVAPETTQVLVIEIEQNSPLRGK